MPRIRFLMILFLVLILSIFSTVLLSYYAVNRSQNRIETEINQLTNKIESLGIKKTIAYYHAFRDKNNIEDTREIAFLLYLEVGLILIIPFLVIFTITRPLQRLSKKLSLVDWKSEQSFKPLPEDGSEEVRVLIRAYNQAIGKLSDYQDQVGDLSRFRGWKEIGKAIVHETNNLLSPVLSYSYLILENSQGENFELARSILQRLDDIRSILNRLKDLTNLPEAVMKPVDLSTIALETAREFGSNRISLEYNGEPLILMLDETLIREALRNIIKNALESAPDVLIRMELANDGDQNVLRVSDNGPGIPRDKLNKIFQVGYSSKEGNLGIGLSIVQHILKEHNVDITVNSVIGEGTVFALYFKQSGVLNEDISS